MATHKDCVEQFRNVLPKLVSPTPTHRLESSILSDDSIVEPSNGMEQLRVRLAEDPDSRLVVLFILLKTCDISNEVRPTSVADPWLDCLLDEFFAQVSSFVPDALDLLFYWYFVK